MINILSYYGRKSSRKPSHGVHEFMIEEWMKSLLNKVSIRHQEELEELRINLTLSLKRDINQIISRIKVIEDKTKLLIANTEIQQIKESLEKKGINCG